MKAVERNAIKWHRCACGCGNNIKPGELMFEVSYKLQGRYWYTEYYLYEHWQEERSMSKRIKLKQILFLVNSMFLVAFMSFLCGFISDTIVNNMIEDKFSTKPLEKVVPETSYSGNTQQEVLCQKE